MGGDRRDGGSDCRFPDGIAPCAGGCLAARYARYRCTCVGLSTLVAGRWAAHQPLLPVASTAQVSLSCGENGDTSLLCLALGAGR